MQLVSFRESHERSCRSFCRTIRTDTPSNRSDTGTRSQYERLTREISCLRTLAQVPQRKCSNYFRASLCAEYPNGCSRISIRIVKQRIPQHSFDSHANRLTACICVQWSYLKLQGPSRECARL